MNRGATASSLIVNPPDIMSVRHNYTSLGQYGVLMAAGLTVVDGSSGSYCGFRFHISLLHEIVIHFYQLNLIRTSLMPFCLSLF